MQKYSIWRLLSRNNNISTDCSNFARINGNFIANSAPSAVGSVTMRLNIGKGVPADGLRLVLNGFAILVVLLWITTSDAGGSAFGKILDLTQAAGVTRRRVHWRIARDRRNQPLKE